MEQLQEKEVQSFRLRLPRPLHKSLRTRAFHEGKSLNKLLVDLLKIEADGQPSDGQSA